jgi:hypothetical protein
VRNRWPDPRFSARITFDPRTRAQEVAVSLMIRPVEPKDTDALVEVSLAADTLFAEAGLDLPPDDPREMLGHVERVLVAVADRRVRGLAATVTLDGATGETDIGTVSGNASLRDVSGGLAFNSVSGQLAVAGGRVSSLRAKTVSGSVLADTDVAPAARVRINTVSGEVALRVPADTSASVEIRNASSSVDSDFGLDRSGGRARTVLSGRIGSGVDPATITINSASNRTALLRRAPETPAAIPEGA